jgi:Rieske Fe-S protein
VLDLAVVGKVAALPSRKYPKPGIDLVLAVLCATNEETGEPVTPPGHCRSFRELSDICTECGCKVSWQNFHHISQRAMRKLRCKLHFQKDPFLREAVENIIGRAPTP